MRVPDNRGKLAGAEPLNIPTALYLPIYDTNVVVRYAYSFNLNTLIFCAGTRSKHELPKQNGRQLYAVALTVPSLTTKFASPSTTMSPRL